MHQILMLKCFSSHLVVAFLQSIEARCYVENEDVIGAAPTGDAPTTSVWSTILLPTKVWLILEVWECIQIGGHVENVHQGKKVYLRRPNSWNNNDQWIKWALIHIQLHLQWQ